MSIYLTPHHHPRAKVFLSFVNKWRIIDCLVDTGFSSGIAINSQLKEKVNKQFVAAQEFELANGQRMLGDVYKVKVKYQNLEKKILAIFINGDDNLLGIEFLGVS